MNVPARFLLVSGDPALRARCEAILSPRGIVLDSAEKTAGVPRDGVLVDCRTAEGASGIAAARGLAPGTPLIALVAAEHDGVAALESGADEVVAIAALESELAPAFARGAARASWSRALSQSEQQYRAMVENSFDGFELLDAAGRPVYVSPTIERMTGYTPEERLRQSTFELFDPEDAERARAVLERLVARPGGSALIEFRYRHKDGSWRWAHGAGINRLHDPAIRAIVVNYRDITARQLAEKALRRLAFGMSETGDALFRAVVQHLVEALGADFALVGELSSDRDRVATIATFGTGPVAAGDEFDLNGTPCETAMHRGLFSVARSVRQIYGGDAFLSQMGAEAYIGTPLFDAAGEPLGIMAVLSREPMRDTSAGEAMLQIFGARVGAELERRRAEKQLRASEARYRALLEEASDGIVVFDEDLAFSEANGSMCAMLGYTREEFLAMHADAIIAREDLIADPIPMELLKAGIVRRVERRFIKKDGGIVPVETKTKRLQDGRFLSVVRDMTERFALRERDEQLRQAQKIEAIGRLAGGVAHDFNNVLTAIMGYADLLMDDFREDDPRYRDLGEIKKAAERAAALTRQLLAFSRKQVLQPIILDVNEVVGNIDRLLRRLLGDEIEFTIDPGPSLGRVRADAGQLEQVLINLAVNARDAMPEGGRLFITTRNADITREEATARPPIEPGSYVLLTVADTGHGIDPTIRAHVFEPFFTTKPQGQGTGLGLATVYGVVKQSGGYIFLDSDPGKGTTFRIYLPQVGGAPGAPDIVLEQPMHEGRTVLIVEDEPAVRSLASGVLRRQGFRVLEAADADSAMRAMATDTAIDLLLTDIVMPGTRGDALAGQLRERRPTLKVVFMSGYVEEQVRSHAKENGIPFVQKPFAPTTLVQVVREALGS